MKQIIAAILFFAAVFAGTYALLDANTPSQPETQAEPYIAPEAPKAAKMAYVVAETEMPIASSYYLGPCEDTYLRDDIPLTYEEQAMLYGACLEFEVDYALALAVVEQETTFRNLTGDGGDSEGYMQIQKKWWSELMSEIGAENLMEPKDNFRTGCAILSQLIEKYGNVEDALTYYNSGSTVPNGYSKSVLAKMEG